MAGLNALAGTGFDFGQIVLPLGISFYTFTQIAYLVDMYRDPARYRVAPYALFVTYYPHLIAGRPTKESSPLLAGGTKQGAPATDITGRKRTSPPSIGAFNLP